MPRVRHHTSPENLQLIRKDKAITPGRGGGVWVEQEPFGPVLPGFVGLYGPHRRLGTAGEGAYVEFDQPANTVATPQVGGNSTVIPVRGRLALEELNPQFVVVRRWWLFWMNWYR